MTIASHRVAVAFSVATVMAFASLLDTTLRAEAEEGANALIDRVVAQTTRAGLAIRATRELRAGTTTGKHQGWMTVETAVTPTGGFTWNVLEEGGSERTREKVFKSLLQNESEAWRAGGRDDASLSPANYVFTPIGTPRPGQIQIRLTPRRTDPKLVDGILTVSNDGYPLRLEGKLAKSPSFWVKSVSVVKRYGRFAGVALPTTLETTADVKMVGVSTFTMRYQYTEVNGRNVTLNASGSND